MKNEQQQVEIHAYRSDGFLYINGVHIDAYPVRLEANLYLWFFDDSVEALAKLMDEHSDALSTYSLHKWGNAVTGRYNYALFDITDAPRVSLARVQHWQRDAVREAYTNRKINGYMHAEGVARAVGVSVYQVREWCVISLDAEAHEALTAKSAPNTAKPAVEDDVPF